MEKRLKTAYNANKTFLVLSWVVGALFFVLTFTGVLVSSSESADGLAAIVLLPLGLIGYAVALVIATIGYVVGQNRAKKATKDGGKIGLGVAIAFKIVSIVVFAITGIILTGLDVTLWMGMYACVSFVLPLLAMFFDFVGMIPAKKVKETDDEEFDED